MKQKEEKNICYTVGRKDIYDPYIESDKNATKEIGGSVWETYDEASIFAKGDFRVYGVEARWRIDTRPNEYGYHDNILIEGRLFKLEE